MKDYRPAKKRAEVTVGQSVRILREPGVCRAEALAIDRHASEVRQGIGLHRRSEAGKGTTSNNAFERTRDFAAWLT